MRNSCGCLLVGGWPCVQALLSVDNIVLGSWPTEGTWRHEIILCSPDRDREGVTLLWNLPPVRQAALPALSTMNALLHCISQGPQSPFKHFYQKPPNSFHPPFVLFPCKFMSPSTPTDSQHQCTEHQWVIMLIKWKHLKLFFIPQFWAFYRLSALFFAGCSSTVLILSPCLIFSHSQQKISKTPLFSTCRSPNTSQDKASS